MRRLTSTFLCLSLLSVQAFAIPQGTPKPPVADAEGLGSILQHALKPTVLLDKAAVIGKQDGQVSKFLGIKFSKPLGRFRAPELNAPYKGIIDARKYGDFCPQQQLSPPDIGNKQVFDILNAAPELHTLPGKENEDCLFINVVTPPGAVLGKKLPVLVWIHGGAAQVGDSSAYDIMSSRLVSRSIALKEPIIFVSMNYRLAAYGFLGGVEVGTAKVANLALRDQRLALQWVNKYISNFGGDKNKVTIWGQSSGAITGSLQLLTNGGNNQGLFRAAILQSGSPIHVGNVNGPAQLSYNALIAKTGCDSAKDSLDCLRKLPFPKLKKAVDSFPNFFSYQSLVLAWGPTVDGVFLDDTPNLLIPKGKFAKVPIMSGICDDEGTMFALSSVNVTTEADFRTYISTNWNPFNTAAELAPLWNFYPADPAVGAPFSTGARNAITPEFKRTAAYIGDSVQVGPRRPFLEKVAESSPVWAYLSQRGKDTPVLGAYHGSDLAYGTKPSFMDDYILNFVVKLDPNVKNAPKWEPYSAKGPKLYTFPPTGPPKTTLDTFRADAINFLLNVSSLHPF